MVLRDYLTAQGIKLSDLEALSAFGKRFTPEVSGHAVKKWARGERLPRPETLLQIEAITDGKVLMAEMMREKAA